MITRHLKRSLIGSLMLTAAATAICADIVSLPVKTVNGQSYHYYTVQPHETLYALSKQFGVSESEILKMNPEAADGLKSGQQLLLGKASTSTAKNVTSTSGTYEVKKQETAYGISKRFGLTLDEFYALNPNAKDGLKEGQIVTVKAGSNNRSKASSSTAGASNAKSTTTSAGANTHVIAEHETLYQIARDNNVALADLLAANPGLDAARYSAGTTIVIPVKKAASAQAPASGTYQVRTGDTFYGIATRNGISVEQLYAANPGIDILKEGMMINLPDACAEKTEPATPLLSTVKSTSNTPITLAVVLPFQIEQKAKHNKNMVEFYRGFLMAVDSMRNMGQPINILTYDTNGTTEGLKAILDNPDLKKANVIVAPDNAEHLALMNQFGLDNRIAVMNVFNNRDSAFYDNPYTIQAALPRDDMYARAAKAFLDNFNGFVPVILISSDGRSEKTEFTDVVKSMLEASGKPYKELTYSGTLSLEQLAKNLSADNKYAFLPASSHKDEFDKIATALQAYKDGRDFKNEVIVWGYPEWLANRGAYEKMYELDCYIYSRTDLPEPFMTESINEMYKKWFGPTMNANYPRRAYMGFDAGMYLLRAVSSTGGNFEKSLPYVQSITMPITLKRYKNGGLYNDELLLINLAPGETISKRSI